jgi:cysteine-rich repeat protein
MEDLPMARTGSDRVSSVRNITLLSCLLLVGGLLLVVQPAVADHTSTTCPVANCTANDLVAQVSAQAYASGDDECTGVGDTIDIEITHILDSQGGSSKYDIGLYTTIDVPTNLCDVDIIGGSNSVGSLDGSPYGWNDLGEQDACKDLTGSQQAKHVDVHNVKCIDDIAPFGLMDPIVIWQSWANNDDQVTNCTEANVIEGTTAKCRMTVAVPGVVIPGVCGNSIIEPSNNEECDDGNQNDGDGCSSTCIIEFCGDSIINNVDEECDDGNAVSNDGCSATCETEFCGDGILQDGIGETCDDGNNVDLDGCSANCQVEVPTVGTWGLILLMVLLIAVGVLVLRRSSLI